MGRGPHPCLTNGAYIAAAWPRYFRPHGSCSPQAKCAKEFVALSHMAMGNITDALELRIEIADQWKQLGRRLPADYPQLLTAKLNLGRSYLAASYAGKAEEIFNEVYLCKV
jgi:hypothetical protein